MCAIRSRYASSNDRDITKPEHGSVEWRGPPTSFDGFVVDRVLGKGGMGDVYLGRDTTLDRQVALKFISAPEPSPQARGRFLVDFVEPGDDLRRTLGHEREAFT